MRFMQFFVKQNYLNDYYYLACQVRDCLNGTKSAENWGWSEVYVACRTYCNYGLADYSAYFSLVLWNMRILSTKWLVKILICDYQCVLAGTVGSNVRVFLQNFEHVLIISFTSEYPRHSLVLEDSCIRVKISNNIWSALIWDLLLAISCSTNNKNELSFDTLSSPAQARPISVPIKSDSIVS